MEISIQKFKYNNAYIPLHQSVIKLVYDIEITKQPRQKPNVYIEDEVEDIPSSHVLNKRKRKHLRDQVLGVRVYG